MLDKTIILARAKRAAQKAESWWPLSPGQLRHQLVAAIEDELDMDLFRARVDHERALHIGGEPAPARTATTCNGGEA